MTLDSIGVVYKILHVLHSDSYKNTINIYLQLVHLYDVIVYTYDLLDYAGVTLMLIHHATVNPTANPTGTPTSKSCNALTLTCVDTNGLVMSIFKA